MGPNQTYKFCTTEETIKKTRRQTTDWEKIFASDASDKSFISKIQLIHLNSNKKTKSSIKNWSEDLNIHFCK